MEKATLNRIYKEIKMLRKDVHDLRKALVPEVEPEPDEIEAYRESMKEFRAGNYVEWNKIKKRS